MYPILCGIAVHMRWFGIDLYSSPSLTGFGPVFRRVTALAGNWEEAIAEIDCRVDSELSHRWASSAYSAVNQSLTPSTVLTMSSIP